MEHFYLYRITNQVNGKIYVGVHKTRNLDDGYMGSGKVILAAIKKHGVENFHKEILETFDDAAQMFEREKEVVTDEFLARDDTYNLRRGGYGGFDYINSNPEKFLTAKRLASLNKGGVFGTPESRSEKMRRIHRSGLGCQNFKDPVFQKMMSERARTAPRKFQEDHQRGAKNSQSGSFWITDGVMNKKTRDSIPEGWRRGRSILGP